MKTTKHGDYTVHSKKAGYQDTDTGGEGAEPKDVFHHEIHHKGKHIGQLAVASDGDSHHNIGWSGSDKHDSAVDNLVSKLHKTGSNMTKLEELEKSLKEYRELLIKGYDDQYGKPTNIPKEHVIDAKHDNGDDHYDYRVHSGTGEVHKIMLEGEHKGKYIPMGYGAGGPKLNKNAQMGYGDQGGDGGTGAQAGAADAGAAQATAKSDEDVEKKDIETCGTMDSKEDQKIIAEEIDAHNEKKHGEAKDVDSAKKSDISTELVKFDALGQWSLTKASVAPKPKGEYSATHKEVLDGDDGKIEVGGKSVDGEKGKTIENEKRGPSLKKSIESIEFKNNSQW